MEYVTQRNYDPLKKLTNEELERYINECTKILQEREESYCDKLTEHLINEINKIYDEGYVIFIEGCSNINEYVTIEVDKINRSDIEICKR